MAERGEAWGAWILAVGARQAAGKVRDGRGVQPPSEAQRGGAVTDKLITQEEAQALLEAAKRVGASWHQPSRQVPDSIKNELYAAIAACEAGR